MEEDVLNALQTRTAYLPGGFDRDGKIIIVVNISSNDLQLWNRKCLELSIAYLKRSLSASLLQKGVTVIVDAQKSTSRITRTHSRIIYKLFDDVTVNLYLVRSEGFWEKHVEPCTKSHTKGEPIVLSKSRLSKYFDLSNLPEELGGTLQFNYDLWLQQRKAIDEFQKTCEQTTLALDNLHVLLVSNKTLRPTEMDTELKRCAQMHATVQRNIEGAIEMGNRILSRLNEAYAQPMPQLPPPQHEAQNLDASQQAAAIDYFITNTQNATLPAAKRTLPPDLNCERTRIELRLNEIEKQQTNIRTAWVELLHSMREIRELGTLEEGVVFVTNWLLNTAEQKLNQQQAIGRDVIACESLRNAHDSFELECRDTYGFYAELLHRIDIYAGTKSSIAYKDLISQKDFMQFVCRSFATRLERRRNVLITSLRFFRLASEYFERTTAVFESLVMSDKTEDFEAAEGSLQKLKDSQTSLAHMEREIIKEGEKLSDMLAMPVKDALGRDLHIDYSGDIANIREILDTTIVRRNIFSDSVTLQKLTLEQVTHIHTYEQDARMAIKWMHDVYNAMIKWHSYVGCNIHEIQVQKDELQTFQETGKNIFNYGCQLLEASQALRLSCKFDLNATQNMQKELQRTWQGLHAISQEHMIRLRVSAVFHRSVDEYCLQLNDLKMSVRSLMLQQQQQQQHHTQQHQQHRQQPSSTSSGISSEVESQSSPEFAALQESPGQQQQQQPTISSPAPLSPQLPQNERRDLLQKFLAVREQLLVEVGRMVRLGRLLKTRLKEPFVLDAVTGKSILMEDLPQDITSPSCDSGLSTNVSNDTDNSSQDSPKAPPIDAIMPSAPPATITPTTNPATVIVNPPGNNELACAAISEKLSDIAEVAEALDAAIRELQNETDLLESSSSTTSSDKKPPPPPPPPGRSNSTEDWNSPSTEDDSFATASEGHFTPHSHSSSFQTASGRTSSFISSTKTSFDASEIDDTALDFKLPEFTSELSLSFDNPEYGYLPAQQPTPTYMPSSSDSKSPTAAGAETQRLADLVELHSESATPTPDGRHYESIPVESETEMACGGTSHIADAPPMEILTEALPMTSQTPEVSSTSTCTFNQSQQRTNQKPNAAWRRSKYYENITKQTIKGFL